MLSETLAGCREGAALERRPPCWRRSKASGGFKAYKQLPVLRAAVAAHQAKHVSNSDLDQHAKAA
jgi:hypothetical protein